MNSQSTETPRHLTLPHPSIMSPNSTLLHESNCIKIDFVSFNVLESPSTCLLTKELASSDYDDRENEV